MSTVSATSSSSNADAAVGRGLDTLAVSQDTFLKLLTAQLKNQDPSAPMDNNQFMSQLTQMSMLEQVTNLAAANQDLAHSQRLASGVALLGHTVTYIDGDGSRTTGVVQHVDVDGDLPTLTVDGVGGIDPATLVEVR